MGGLCMHVCTCVFDGLCVTVRVCLCVMEASVHWNKQLSIFSCQEKKKRKKVELAKILPLLVCVSKWKAR